jgi:hypothetical protein
MLANKIAQWPRITKYTHSLPSLFPQFKGSVEDCMRAEVVFFYASTQVERNIASDLLICVMLSANETLTTSFNVYDYKKKLC